LRTIVAVVIWLAAVGAALAWVEAYGRTEGATGPVAKRWPAGTSLVLSRSLPTLVVFVHPHCPCSRATLGELEVLLAHYQRRVATRVVFLRPAGFAAEWVETDLFRTARGLHGVDVIRDDEGCETRRFGAQVSGEILLYDPDGVLLFRGGITASRGHHGDNAFRTTIEALLTGQRPQGPVRAPVFGCSLRDRKSCQNSEN
jgi:hypothetical protein